MVIRAIIISLASGAAPAGRMQEDNFIDAVPKGKQYDYSNPAVQGVQFCSKLFEYERRSQNKNHTFEQRKAYRLEKKNRYSMRFGTGLTSRSHVREAVSRQR